MDPYEKTVGEIRSFNRFYTVNMGFLNPDYLDMAYSVAETRILFEMRMRGACVQSDIARGLHMDKSYLSRIIKGFYKRGLVEKDKCGQDRRMTYIRLTEKGCAETERLIEATNRQIGEQIRKLSAGECGELCRAMNVIVSILGREESI